MGQKQEIAGGVAAAPGAAMGRAVCIAPHQIEVFRLPLREGDIPSELERLEQAVEKARQDLETIRHKAEATLGPDLAAIFDAHNLVLSDKAFRGRIAQRIREEQVNAEWAVHETASELAERFRALDVEHMRERSEDVLDVSRYLQTALTGISHQELTTLEESVVLVAHDLTPSEAVRLGRGRVVAFAIETGGRTSHTAIIARSLHIPMVAGLGELTQKVTDDDPLIVDGDRGRVVLHPTTQSREEYRAAETRRRARRARGVRTSVLPAETLDGVRIELLANIDLPEEIDEAVEFGADGIGLYRSEFLYIEQSPQMPTEEEHLELYLRMMTTLAPKPVTVRTFDLGGRKMAQALGRRDEENPVLGMRGVRLTLARPDIFEIQTRALLRAAASGPLRVMLPLVSTLEEVRQFRAMVERLGRDLAEEGLEHSTSLELGIMVEVPVAVWLAPELAKEVSFFSIGTNDLIQYAMAVDRNNDQVSYLYQPFHPAILRMVRYVVEVADRASIDVSVCGEMASEPRAATVLAALGVRRLSLSPEAIPEVKEAIRSIDLSNLQSVTDRMIAASTAEEVVECLNQYSSSSKAHSA